MCKKFGILGALDIAVGILGAPCFRNFGSPKIRKDWSAPIFWTDSLTEKEGVGARIKSAYPALCKRQKQI